MAAAGASHTALEIFSKFRYSPLSGLSLPLSVSHSRGSSVIRGPKNPEKPPACHRTTYAHWIIGNRAKSWTAKSF
jgi:hypothetical protein